MLPIRVLQSCVSDCARPLAAWSRLPRLFDEIFEDSRWPATAAVLPADIRQEGDRWIIEAELPGVSRDNVSITVEDSVLTVSGKYADETKSENAQYHLRERRTGEFSRSFRLPETADTDKIAAELSHGVLTLTVPTREEAKPRRIEVK